RHRDRRTADGVHNARARHRVRHRRERLRNDRRAGAGSPTGRASCLRAQEHSDRHPRSRYRIIPPLSKRTFPMHAAPAAAAASHDSSLTDYVAGFVVDTREQDIPADVAHLGKRSVLDGIGLALAGATSQTGHITRRYLDALGIATESGSTVIGSELRLPARFAAFANGIS